MGSEIRYPDETEMARLMGVDRLVFHRGIKPHIIKDHKDKLTIHGLENPDIGIDKEGCIILRDPRDYSIIIETKTPLTLYKDEDE